LGIKEQETCLTLQERDDDETGAQNIVKEIKQYQKK
jgi:hypothetical protein